MKNVGRGLKIKTVDNQQFEGILKRIEGGKITIELISANRVKTKEEVEVPFANIDTAMVLVSFSKQG